MVSDEPRYRELAQALARGRYRLTPQRAAILRVLADTSEHPSMEEIHEQARHYCRSTSRASVYNTLRVLTQLGEIVELRFAVGGSRYGLRSLESHAHLVCTRCGRIDDFDHAELRASLAAVGAASGYRVTARRLDFYGECPACQERLSHG